MGERLRTSAAQHPGRSLGVLAAVAVLCSALAAGWTERLALSTADSKGPALEVVIRGGLPERSPAFRVAVSTMRSQLSANPAVGTVRMRQRGGSAGSTSLIVRFDVAGRKRDAAIARIERNLDPGPLTVAFRGSTASVRIAKDEALDDAVLLLIALPVVALIAAAILGIRPAGAALLAGAAAAALAALGSELLAGAFDVTWLALAGAGAGGSLVALQLCGLGRAGASPAALWAGGIAAAATFGATAALGVDYLTSLGVGGGLGSLLAAPAAIAATGSAEGMDPEGGVSGGAPWRWISTLVGWSRLVAAGIALLGAGLLLIAAAPAERLVTAAIGATVPPAIEAAEVGAAAGAAALATLLLSSVQSRRFSLSLFATLAAGLPAAAAVGLLVVTFQEGGLDLQLDYVSNGAVQLGSLTAAVVVVGALCSSHAVAIGWASRRAEGGSGVERVAEAMGRCGPAALLSCLAGIVAGTALAFGSARFLKEFALGTAAGLALELVVVQALIAPGLLRLTHRGAADQ
jgi:hypothetical protein